MKLVYERALENRSRRMPRVRILVGGQVFDKRENKNLGVKIFEEEENTPLARVLKSKKGRATQEKGDLSKEPTAKLKPIQPREIRSRKGICKVTFRENI